jgi:hypothetical protein
VQQDVDRAEAQIDRTEEESPDQGRPTAYLLDLIIYLSALFLSREIYISQLGFIASAILSSLLALAVATWRMRARGVRWADLGLRRPSSVGRMSAVAAITVAAVIVSIIAFEIIKDLLPFALAPDTSSGGSRFGDLEGNLARLMSIIVFIWLESALEELIDRGFLLNWLERLFSKTSLRTVLAVVIQAALFGFRHSHDLSERSVMVGLIGLVLGIAYVVSGRNLWPLIVAHCALNSMSMLERVF